VQVGVANTTSAFKTLEEERQGREEAVDAQLQVFPAMLSIWLKQMSTLDDPRQAKNKTQTCRRVTVWSAVFCFSNELPSTGGCANDSTLFS
jgi:hypothetical protein